MIVDLLSKIKRISSFAQGAYLASDIKAFNTIANDLNEIILQLENNNFHSSDANLSINIDDLGISTRAVRILRFCLEIETAGDLIKKTASDLLKTPNFGRTSYTQVVQSLGKLGLTLKD